MLLTPNYCSLTIRRAQPAGGSCWLSYSKQANRHTLQECHCDAAPGWSHFLLHPHADVMVNSVLGFGSEHMVSNLSYFHSCLLLTQQILAPLYIWWKRLQVSGWPCIYLQQETIAGYSYSTHGHHVCVQINTWGFTAHDNWNAIFLHGFDICKLLSHATVLLRHSSPVCSLVILTSCFTF